MLYKKIQKFQSKKPKLYCTPGHKGKMPPCFCAGLDITELAGTDNLYNPQGMIAQSQQNAAKIFGAKEILFLTSGATQGIFAMLGAFQNQSVMIPRGSHKSIFEACQFFGITPVFEGEEGSFSARLVIYPDYYGRVFDIKTMYKECRQKGVFLLVDSAHGSHFGFDDRLPESAVLHSDLCVMSAHKTLPALTQAAYLAIGNGDIEKAVKKVYASLGTTSPSYPILASLDYAANFLAKQGRQRLDRLFSALQKIKENLPPAVKVCENGDFTRLVLDVSDTGMEGFEVEALLNKQGIYPEFADRTRVVFIFTMCDKPKKGLLKKFPVGEGRVDDLPLPAVRRVLPFLQAGKSRAEQVDISRSAGRIAASEVGFYPPCIPLVVRGEEINQEVCDIIMQYADKLFGVCDQKVWVTT